jgi:hypothetical protein
MAMPLALVRDTDGRSKYHLARSGCEVETDKQYLLQALCGRKPELSYTWIVTVPPTHTRYHSAEEVCARCKVVYAEIKAGKYTYSDLDAGIQRDTQQALDVINHKLRRLHEQGMVAAEHGDRRQALACHTEAQQLRARRSALLAQTQQGPA